MTILKHHNRTDYNYVETSGNDLLNGTKVRIIDVGVSDDRSFIDKEGTVDRKLYPDTNKGREHCYFGDIRIDDNVIMFYSVRLLIMKER